MRICELRPKQKTRGGTERESVGAWDSGLAFTITDDDRVLVIPYERKHWFPEYGWYECWCPSGGTRVDEGDKTQVCLDRVRWHIPFKSVDTVPYERGPGYYKKISYCHWDKKPVDIMEWIQVNDPEMCMLKNRDMLGIAKTLKEHYDKRFGPDARKH